MTSNKESCGLTGLVFLRDESHSCWRFLSQQVAILLFSPVGGRWACPLEPGHFRHVAESRFADKGQFR